MFREALPLTVLQVSLCSDHRGSEGYIKYPSFKSLRKTHDEQGSNARLCLGRFLPSSFKSLWNIIFNFFCQVEIRQLQKKRLYIFFCHLATLISSLARTINRFA